MVQVLLLICIGLSIVSAFFAVRGMYRLHRERAHKMFTVAVVIFLFLPLGFALFLVLALRQDMSVWIFVAMLLFAGIWIFQGYYLEVYLRKLLKMKQSGQSPIVRKPTVHLQRNCIISLLAAWAVWSYGVFVGIWWPLLETCGICVFIYLNIASIYKLWRYRGF